MKHLTMIFLGAAILALSACAQKAVEAEKAETAVTAKQEAQEYYQKGNDTFYRIWLDGYKVSLDEAIPLYEKAVELDPDFALAYARLARAHLRMRFNVDRTPERLAKAKSALDKALALAPDHPEVHLAHGCYYYFRPYPMNLRVGSKDWESALEQAELGLKGQPDNSELVALVGMIKRRQGKWEEAIAAMKKSAELDPDHVDWAGNAARTCLIMRNWAEAERFADRTLLIAPEITRGYNYKAELYLWSKGDIEKARGVMEAALEKVGPDILIGTRSYIEILARDYQKALDIEKARTGGRLRKADIYRYLSQPEQAAAYYDSVRITYEEQVRNNPDDYAAHGNLGVAYAGLGRREEAIREGKLAVEIMPLSREPLIGLGRILTLARIYTLLGEQDAAIDQLEVLLSIPSGITVPLLKLDPQWDPLREHPRYKALVEKYE